MIEVFSMKRISCVEYCEGFFTVTSESWKEHIDFLFDWSLDSFFRVNVSLFKILFFFLLFALFEVDSLKLSFFFFFIFNLCSKLHHAKLGCCLKSCKHISTIWNLSARHKWMRLERCRCQRCLQWQVCVIPKHAALKTEVRKTFQQTRRRFLWDCKAELSCENETN